MRTESANCDRARDAALYVLGELHGRQLDGFARHLRECEQCGEEVELLEIASDAVPLLTARQVPPAEEDAVQMRAAPRPAAHKPVLHPLPGGATPRTSGGATPRTTGGATPRTTGGATPRTTGGAPARTAGGAPRRARAGERAGPPRPRTRRTTRTPVPRAGLVGFMALAVLAIATVALSGQAAGIRYARIQAGWPRGGAAIKLEGDRLELLVEGMPLPASGTGYQVWVVDTTSKRLVPTSAWVRPNGLGQAGVAVPGDFHRWDAVAVYVEPLTGPDTTRSGAAAVGDLRSLR